ncbi:hypothetical protein EJ03DRAFT_35510 [Teratosphaeria nubilosa]|uniref:Uncharacterized protein n=1 Tax=Teratosphaeria nubilosa TaxID=161662 RepID=A0A6G1KUU8_9PEZI|nr:hypothetical protein EJ03DRAFT_35510 [Teratosphaeria nubilosa]
MTLIALSITIDVSPAVSAGSQSTVISELSIIAWILVDSTDLDHQIRLYQHRRTVGSVVKPHHRVHSVTVRTPPQISVGTTPNQPHATFLADDTSTSSPSGKRVNITRSALRGCSLVGIYTNARQKKA